jgi:A/G-specific adenine glycosylase
MSPVPASSSLLRWYQKNGRTLPWRSTRDPYCILVSEIMLQQTQVARVLFFYDRWLKQFPDWKKLAEASNVSVIQAWAGLGYNRRALMLRDIAKQVVERGVPISEQEWRSLKGIGPYTAAALTSFSLQKRALPIDTNIRRVIGRACLGIPYPDLKDDETILSALDRFTPVRGKYYDIPQALFDVATMICRKKTPQCLICPLASICKAKDGFLKNSHTAPAKGTKKPKERIHFGKKFPDRIFRGRILSLVRTEPKKWTRDTIGPQTDETFNQKNDHVWIQAMIDRLIEDGLMRETRGKLHL